MRLRFLTTLTGDTLYLAKREYDVPDEEAASMVRNGVAEPVEPVKPADASNATPPPQAEPPASDPKPPEPEQPQTTPATGKRSRKTEE